MHKVEDYGGPDRCFCVTTFMPILLRLQWMRTGIQSLNALFMNGIFSFLSC